MIVVTRSDIVGYRWHSVLVSLATENVVEARKLRSGSRCYVRRNNWKGVVGGSEICVRYVEYERPYCGAPISECYSVKLKCLIGAGIRRTRDAYTQQRSQA